MKRERHPWRLIILAARKPFLVLPRMGWLKLVELIDKMPLRQLGIKIEEARAASFC